MNVAQALYVNTGYFKCISGINLSPANKSLFTIAFILYFQNKVFIMGKSLRISTFIPVKLLNNPVTSFYLKNFDFLLFHAEHFEKSIILPFLVFTT